MLLNFNYIIKINKNILVIFLNSNKSYIFAEILPNEASNSQNISLIYYC